MPRWRPSLRQEGKITVLPEHSICQSPFFNISIANPNQNTNLLNKNLLKSKNLFETFLYSRNGFGKFNRLMSSQVNNNEKSFDHLLFEKNPIFAFFHEEVSMTYNSVYTQVHTGTHYTYTHIHTRLHCQTHTRIHRHKPYRLRQTVNGMEKEKLYIFLLH